jgi:hypothetical protein
VKSKFVALVFLLPPVVYATPADLIASYRAAAKLESPTVTEFSAPRGLKLYTTQVAGVACESCHGASPKGSGKHATTGKAILPLAPVANPQRFTDPAKVEKWFKRNCNDVLKRSCTATEKGDFITYLVSVK